MQDFTAAVFEPHLQTTFTLAEPRVDMVLAEVNAPNGATSRPFTLIFRGPGNFALPQQIYSMNHAGLGELELFLVPVGPREGSMQYEAVFN